MSRYFSVAERGEWHWDVSDGRQRIFRIRGKPGDFVVIDERHPGDETTDGFATIDAAMAFITADLMQQPVALSGSAPTGRE